MISANVIGHLGADAVVKNSNGKEFVTFRVAHTNKWRDEKGQSHEETVWVDCVYNGAKSVSEYLKRGTHVFVSGNVSLRVYSSKKDRCMKAGMTISVRQVELLGGRGDDVPSVLFRGDDGSSVGVSKYYKIDMTGRENGNGLSLISANGRRYWADGYGWVSPQDTAENE